MEYKSPKDYLSVDDFYKADTAQADSIAIHDITITFVCHRYPRSLMRHLTDELEETEMAKRLIEQYGKHKENNLYKSVMDLIVRANRGKFEEAKIMCEALEELMKDELEAKKAEGLALGKAEGIITLLKDLGEVSEKLQQNIMEQNDTEVLDRWLRYAARAETIQDFEQKIQ